MEPMHEDEGLTVEMLLSHAIQQFITKTMENPVQRMLLIMTLRSEIRRIGYGEVSGLIDLVKKTFNNEGIFGFLRGLGTDFALTLPGFVNEVIANYYTSQLMNRLLFSMNPDSLTPLKEILLNVSSSACVSILAIPATSFRETVVTHLQADTRIKGQLNYRYSGAVDCIRRLYRGGGIRSFYQGCLLGTATIFIYRLTYYGSFSLIVTKLPERYVEMMQLPIAFGLTLTCGLFTQPLEVIRRRMMLAAKSAGKKTADGSAEDAVLDKKYNGVIDCARSIVREGGYPALWEGLGARMGFSLALLGVRAAAMMFN